MMMVPAEMRCRFCRRILCCGEHRNAHEVRSHLASLSLANSSARSTRILSAHQADNISIGSGRGGVLTPRPFLSLGGRSQALSDLKSRKRKRETLINGFEGPPTAIVEGTGPTCEAPIADDSFCLPSMNVGIASPRGVAVSVETPLGKAVTSSCLQTPPSRHSSQVVDGGDDAGVESALASGDEQHKTSGQVTRESEDQRVTPRAHGGGDWLARDPGTPMPSPMTPCPLHRVSLMR